jgi:hypothetical protein
MTGQILLGLIVGLPLAIGLIFRVSTSHIFFTLMAGELLGRYIGQDLDHKAGLSEKFGFAGLGEILFLVTPMLLTSFLFRGSVSRGKVVLHIFPLIIVGVIFATFLLPLLPLGIQKQVQSFAIGEWFIELNKAIIIIMVVIQLLAHWLLNKPDSEHKHKKHEDEHTEEF